jgi:hypothetical protein
LHQLFYFDQEDPTVFVALRIPSDADQRSEVMAIAIPK